MKFIFKLIFKILGALLGVFVLVVGIYVGYVMIQYNRIEDAQALVVNHPSSSIKKVSLQTEYQITTYNIGFGAYSPDFDFFMDSGVMKDGKKVTGHRGTAISKEHVLYDIAGAAKTIQDINPDFAFFQEVDTRSTRSYEVNQDDYLRTQFDEYDHVHAINFHSAYLLYPFHDPHGKARSGITTLSRYTITEATRYSFTVSKSLSKFFDLDRCFSVSSVEVENGHQLLLVNLHMSAYDKGGKIRAKQMEELNAFLAQAQEKGDYVIAGGDFNHDLLTYNPNYAYTFESLPFANQTEQQKPEWLASFFDENGKSGLPEGYQVIASDNISTCRGADMPWQEGVNYVTVIDGFIVSSNVHVVAHQNIATSDDKVGQYAYSDHQPAWMSFTLE